MVQMENAHLTDDVESSLLADRLRTYEVYERRALTEHEGACRIDGDEPAHASAEPAVPRDDSGPAGGRAAADARAANDEPDPSTLPAWPISPKARMKIDRQAMPAQDPLQRASNFAEVNLGFGEHFAMLEAMRCLQCKKAACIAGCPVRVNIPRFLGYVAEGNFAAAAESLLADNALPAVTGRVCPQETQCEAECVRIEKGAPVGVG